MAKSTAVKSAPKKPTPSQLRKIRTSIQDFCDFMTLKRVDFDNLVTEFQNTDDEVIGIRPRLYALLRRYSADLMSIDTIDTLDKVKHLHLGICNLGHINPKNIDDKTRYNWTHKDNKVADEERIKAPYEYVQMMSDLKRVFKAKSDGGLCEEVVYEKIKDEVSGKDQNIPLIQTFDIFGTYATYAELLKALNDQKQANQIQDYLDCIEKIELITKRAKALNRTKDLKALAKYRANLQKFVGSNGLNKAPLTKQKVK